MRSATLLVFFVSSMALAQPVSNNCRYPNAACQALKFRLVQGNTLCLNSTTCTTTIAADSSTGAMTFTSGVANAAGSARNFVFNTVSTMDTADKVLDVQNHGSSLFNIIGVGVASFSSDLVISGTVKPFGSVGIVGTSSNPLGIASQVADSGSATGLFLGGSVNTFTTSGAKILKFCNPLNGGTCTEKANVSKDGDFFANGGADPVPAFHTANQSVAQSIERGGATSTAGGVLAVSFNTSFGSAPTCVCADQNASPVSCGISTTSTTSGVTFTIGSARADPVQWICIGNK